MSIIDEEQGIGDLPPILIVRRSNRLTEKMVKEAGGSRVTIDLTSDTESVDVPGAGTHAGNRWLPKRNVSLKKRPVGGSLEGDVFLPSVVGKTGKVDGGGEIKKGNRKGGSLEGDVLLPSVVGKTGKVDGGVEVKKGKRKRSKYFIVSKDQGGDDGMVKKAAGKRKLGVNRKNGKKGLADEENEDVEYVNNDVGVRKRVRKSKFVGEDVGNNKGEKGVGSKVLDVDRVHQRISLWSLHRLLPNLSQRQREDVMAMGFGDVLGFRIKDVPTRLCYWLLDNFDEERRVLNVDGKATKLILETPLLLNGSSSLKVRQGISTSPSRNRCTPSKKEDGCFLVLYFTSIGESNRNATVNLRFFNCIQSENDIPGFDWCSYVLECLVRTKKTWIRNSHYCGPLIVLLVVYAESMRQSIGHEDVQMPLVNRWTVELFNKLEEERLSPKNVEVSPKCI